MTESYRDLMRAFRWSIPERFNIATACVERWAAAEPDRPALLRYDRGQLHATSFGELNHLSDRLAAGLAARGFGAGDRLAILLPQSVETVTAHMAAYKLGAIAVPLAALFGAEALQYRLVTSGATAIVTDGAGLAKLNDIAGALPCRTCVLCIDGAASDATDYHRTLAEAPSAFATHDSGPHDPALMIFTSGTTGKPKGTLHAHRVLLGHLPGISFSHDGFPAPQDRFWTPSDWAWAGGLLNVLLPSLYHGVPVVFGTFGRFDPEGAMALMAAAGVVNAFLPPTAIRMLEVVKTPGSYRLHLRTMAAAGERLGAGAYAWVAQHLGLTVNEFYGQTECNYVLGSSSALGVSRAGALGVPIPGHRVRLCDPAGSEAPIGEPGEIAIHRSDPSMFLGYWRDPEGTAARFRGDWLMTGDLAVVDADGYWRFIGRNDDLIISSGYRIGPAEIEDCLQAHPAVSVAAVVGKPDPLRTEIVKAYVVLNSGYAASAALVSDIQGHVRTALSAAEYPREIAFVEDIPMTTSGKIVRRHFRTQAHNEGTDA